MADRASADRACKDPNPIIDGRKANVNLAYLGAKPRVIQPGKAVEHTFCMHQEDQPRLEHVPAPLPGFAFGVPQIHPAFIQRPYGYVELQKCTRLSQKSVFYHLQIPCF